MDTKFNGEPMQLFKGWCNMCNVISISISIRKCEVILLKLPVVSLSGASFENEPELFLLAWRVDAQINFMEAFGAERTSACPI